MKICRFVVPGETAVRTGLVASDGQAKQFVLDLSSYSDLRLDSLEAILNSAETKGQRIDDFLSSELPRLGHLPRFDLAKVWLRPPVVPPEVWAAGVTYHRSRDAREVETSLKGLYSYVYDAERPEIFLKTTGIRVVGPEEEVCVRSDSRWTVPEPELTIVLDGNCETVGYTVGDDVSARDIEGLNPLYLPQAKNFIGCCSVGPVVVTPKEIPDPQNLQVGMIIFRQSKVVFEGRVSTSSLKRRISELVSFLGRDNVVPSGTLLMTGTGIVPPDDFRLEHGDLVEIEIESIGKLRNVVRQL